MSNFRVEISETLFKQMIDSVKHCVAQRATRKMQEYIKLCIVKNKVTAYACDNYRAARTTITIFPPTEDVFECYIKPINIRPSKNGVNKVVIERENDIATVEAMTEYGKIKYSFKQYLDKFVDLDKIFQDTEQGVDRNIGINPNYLKQAATALSHITNKYREGVILKTQEKNNANVLVIAKNANVISEQLIVPMRITNE